ncbi:IS3 family transposase [Pseudarthrobacter sp. MDT1-22]
MPQGQLLRLGRGRKSLRSPQGSPFPPRPLPEHRRSGSAAEKYVLWYNTERIFTKLEGLSPAQYRTQTLAAQV